MKNLFLIALFLLSNLALGQIVVSPKVAQGQDIFKENLYSADRIMEARKELKLTDAQAAKIKKIHADNAGEFSTLKWDLDEANSKLKLMLEQTKIDQAAVSKQMDVVLEIENKLKKKQLNSLVAIKNELTADQIDQLDKPVKATSVYGYVAKPNTVTGVGSIRSGSTAVVGYPSSSFYSSGDGQTKVYVQGANSDKQPSYYEVLENGKHKKIDQKQLSEINPNDIESISVLKDKSATDLFGEDGKNGVILITLKKK